LDIDSNAGNSEFRYDIVVCNHEHTVTVGGDPATYEIIKGPVSNPIKPVLTDPLKQTLVGTIELPPNASDVADMIYTKAKCPDSGDGEDARLFDVNQFRKLQQQNRSSLDLVSYSDSVAAGPGVAYLYAFQNDGNVFRLNPEVPSYIDGFKISDALLQQGTRVHIHITDKCTLRQHNAWEAGALYNRGYRSLTLPPSLTNVNIAGGTSALGVKPLAGESWEMEFLFFNDRWLLISIGGAGSLSRFLRGHIIDWYGDWATNFDASGLGINLMAGWALCNGNNSTPDLRGRLRAMATNLPAAGRPRTDTPVNMETDGLDPKNYISGDYGVVQGKSADAILQVHLPNYDLPVTDGGHHHEMLNSDSYPSAGKPVTGGQPQEGANLQTLNAVTGINVNSGGGGEVMPITNPVISLVTIMKI